MNDTKYYSKLKGFNGTLVDLLATDSFFSDVPQSWHVVVVDIENSTQAVAEGKHHQINLTATGAIISVLNTIRREQKLIEIPYFFGGDGATFIIPANILNNIIAVLNNYSVHIKRNTNLTLRVGHVSVENLNAQNLSLRLAKHLLTEQLTIPIVLGNGLKRAEELIKNTFIENSLTDFKQDLLNLEGMECRWKEINPKTNKNKVVCLLLDAVNESNQSIIYREVLMELDALFGTFEMRQPISSHTLKLDFNISNIWEEMKVSLVDKNWIYLFKNWIVTIIGAIYLNLSRNGKQYLKQIGPLSHTFMMDGMINTIFTGDENTIAVLTAYLDQLEKDKKIVYGIHVTHASIMSCYVLDRKTKHAHFVDGTTGGYTSAAKMLKQKWLSLK